MKCLTLFLSVLVLVLNVACGRPSSSQNSRSELGPSKNLLIIGDSISMGYSSHVQKDLSKFYNVAHVTVETGEDENAKGTTYTLANLYRWLHQAPSHLDVITWNNGLWNARDPNLDPQAPGNATDLATYQAELILIATKLKATGARIIFVTTTDIPTVEVSIASAGTFIPGRDLDENAIALATLPAMGIEVYDLNALARSNPKLHHTDDSIHFNTQGYSLFGEFISDMVVTNYEISN